MFLYSGDYRGNQLQPIGLSSVSSRNGLFNISPGTNTITIVAWFDCYQKYVREGERETERERENGRKERKEGIERRENDKEEREGGKEGKA